MIRKILFIVAVTVSAYANATVVNTKDSLYSHAQRIFTVSGFEELEPTYVNGAIHSGSWKDNWFVNVSGGVSSFIGSPIGCNDLFGRMKPVMQVSVGKWFTPSVGSRMVFQGFSFKDSENASHTYRNYHTDLMWNLTSALFRDDNSLRWSIIPYAGLGLLHNDFNDKNPFAFSYGIAGQYRVSDRLRLTMELGGTTTFKDFDGRGDSREFGDNLFNLSAGLSFSFGKAGWKKIVDAEPYINQNHRMADYIAVLKSRERALKKKYETSVEVAAELRKILAIEGLLDKYKSTIPDVNFDGNLANYSDVPRNDYSGLNSLRRRLGMNRQTNNPEEKHTDNKQGADSSKRSSNKHRSHNSNSDKALADNECIGFPIHFFFVIGTSDFTDQSQLVNLDEIARIAKKHDLCIRIIGSADSSTGEVNKNKKLSASRADYVHSLLVQRGLSANQMEVIAQGGIDKYSPIPANRQVAVELFYRLD